MHSKSSTLLVLLAVPLTLIAGSRPVQAEMITFANTAGQSGGTFTIGNTVQISGGPVSAVAVTGGASAAVSGACGTWGCLELVTGAYIGPDDSTDANDYVYSGSGSSITITGTATGTGASGTLYSGVYDPTTNIRLTFDNNCVSGTCLGSLAGTLDGGTLDTVLASFFGVPTTLNGGSTTSLFFNYSGSLAGSARRNSPVGGGVANTNSLQTRTVPVSVPDGDPSTALLLTIGALGLCLFVRRPQAWQES